MWQQLTPGRSTAIGTTAMMACACATASNSAKLLGISPKIVQTSLISIGALFIVSGLWRMARPAAWLAVAAFATLASAAALTPPTLMSTAHMPWHAPQLAGGILYLVFAAILGCAFWMALPSASPGGTATAIAGTAVATGCTCCMIAGAIGGLAVSGGGSVKIFEGTPSIYLTGLAVAALGLGRLRGLRPLPWIVAGGLVTQFGGFCVTKALQLFPAWTYHDVNMRFIPGYIIYVTGAALIVKAWAVAYEPALTTEPVGMREPVPQAAI